MTTLTLHDFLGITAEFELGSPLTLVLGANGAGKSRLGRALGAVLVSEISPLTGSKRGDGKDILSHGTDRAFVKMLDAGSMRSIVWPKGEITAKGDQTKLGQASVWAAGLRHPLDLHGKERAQAFADIFKTEPTKHNLGIALQDRGLSQYLVPVWDGIELSGWDAAASKAADHAKAAKRAWHEVTGRDWGSSIGETWQPDEKIAPDRETLEQQLREAESVLADTKAALEKTKAKRATLPPTTVAGDAQACPHCGGTVVVRLGKVVAAENVDPKKEREIRMAIAAADGDVGHAQDQVYHRERAVGEAQARLRDASTAREKATTRAAKLHREIMEQLAIAEVCGPQGLRKAKLEYILLKVNEDIARTANTVKLPAVWLDDDLELRRVSDGELYRRLSRGEQFLARVLLQIEIAKRDGSTMIVVDDLDVPISLGDRSRVLLALHDSGLQSLVLLAARAPALEFDLSLAGWGKTLWIERVYEQAVDQETGEIYEKIKSRIMPIAEAVQPEQRAA